MASRLSGISRDSLTLVRRNVVPLIVATVLPVLLMSVFGAANIVLSLNDMVAAQSNGTEAPQAVSVANLARFFAFGFAGMFFYCWMVAKVSKPCLTGETATIIGSGGTLRAGFWVMLYNLAATLVLFIPVSVILALAPVFGFSLVIEKGAANLAMVLLAALVAVLCFGWAQCRFIVGFPPLALGERPGLFSGWKLSRGCSFALFGRVVVALLILMIGMIVVLEALNLILPMLLRGAALPAVTEDGEASAALLITVLVPQLVTLLLSVPIYWYLIVLFCMAHQRLSET